MKRFLTVYKFVVAYFITPLALFIYRFYYRHSDKRNPLPKCTNPLLLKPSHKLAQMLRKREIKSYDLVKAYIDRINEINPILNCVVKTCYEEALEEAKKADAILDSLTLPEKYSEQNAPLLGVPFSCKECFWVKGMPNSTGLIARKDFRAPEDADIVQNMRQAGCILVCLTNTSELCMWLESSNYFYGTTKNPYNTSRIVGGSSGGEGCLISAGGSVIGVASDIGGSIRMPAYFNGIYGHKPSSFLVSNKTQWPPASGIQEFMLVSGPLCRYASDLGHTLKIFAGEGFKKVSHKFETNVDFKKLKFFCIKSLQGNLLATDPSIETLNALNKAISFIENSFGVKVEELNLPRLKMSTNMWVSMFTNNGKSDRAFTRLLTDLKEPQLNPYLEIVKSALGLQKKHTLPALMLAIFERSPMHKTDYYVEECNKLREELQVLLGDDGILISPSFPTLAPYHNQAFFTNLYDYIYYGLYNALGFPVTQIPMGLCEKQGLPTGVQLVANQNCDHLTIRLAEYFESNLVGWVPSFQTS